MRGAVSVPAADLLDADDADERGRLCSASLTLKLKAVDDEEEEEEKGREAVARVVHLRELAKACNYCIFFRRWRILQIMWNGFLFGLGRVPS